MSTYPDILRLFKLFSENDKSNLAVQFNDLIDSINHQKDLDSQRLFETESRECTNFSKLNIYSDIDHQAYCMNELQLQISRLTLIKQIIEFRKSLKPNIGPYLEITLQGPPNFSGGFANIYICQYNNTDVAVKLSKSNRLNDDQNLTTRELKRFIQLKYPYLADCIGHTYVKASEAGPAQLGIVTKYYKLGSLSDLIKQNALTHTQKLSICINLSKAIEFIHIHRLCHFDVKPANVLIDDQINPKLSDLGTCQKQKLNYKKSLAFTLGYAPPEQMRGKAVKESDVWSFGMTVYAVFSGKSPFKDIKEDKEKYCKQGMIQILEELNLPDFNGVDEKLVKVVKMCCKVDPKDRARLKDVRGKLNKILERNLQENRNNAMVPQIQKVQEVVM